MFKHFKIFQVFSTSSFQETNRFHLFPKFPKPDVGHPAARKPRAVVGKVNAESQVRHTYSEPRMAPVVGGWWCFAIRFGKRYALVKLDHVAEFSS